MRASWTDQVSGFWQGMSGSPLYIDGVLYVSTARNVVHAIGAKSGERLWTYTPIIIPNPNLGLVNRGIAAYDGKIYMGMLDAHLVASTRRYLRVAPFDVSADECEIVGDRARCSTIARSCPPRPARAVWSRRGQRDAAVRP